MGEGEKRRIRRTARIDSSELARLSGKVDTAAAAWDEPIARAEGSGRLLLSRTATLDDPLTTSLLAEITRRTRTVEMSPEQIADAIASGEADAREPDEPGPPGDADRAAPHEPT